MKLTSAAAALVLLALTGCGGSDSSFAEDYNRAVEPLSRLGQGMGTQASEFDRLARRTEQTRDRLAKLEPPDDAREEFDSLLAQLDQVTGDVSAVARATRSKDVVRQRRAARRLVRSSNEVLRAERALRQAVEG
jgi:ABC-type transporter Mla subunit MlaD